MSSFTIADRHGGTEHRQEAVAADHLRQPIGHEHGTQGDQRFCSLGEPQRPRRGPERQAAQDLPDRPSHQHSEQDLASQFPPHPRPAERCGREQDRGMHEGEGEAVVESSLAGQRETHLVLAVGIVGGLPDLDLGGEHGVSGGQCGAQQQSGRHTHAQQTPRQHRRQSDEQRHADSQQPPRRAPSAQAQGPVQGQPNAHQRHDHTHLREVLDHVGIQRWRRHPRHLSRDHPNRDEDDRRRQGQSGQQARQDGRAQQRQSSQGVGGAHRGSKVSGRHATRQRIAQPVDHANAGADDLVEHLAVRRFGVRAGRGDAFGQFHLAA